MDSPGSGLCSVELLLRTCVQTVVLVSCNKPVGGGGSRQRQGSMAGRWGAHPQEVCLFLAIDAQYLVELGRG